MTIKQHSSHRALLSPVRPQVARHAPVDAIIVPSARPAEYLRHAATLAKLLDCALVVLASKTANRAAIRAAIRYRRLHVYDVPAVVPHLPTFRTSLLVRREGLLRPTDVSVKRNLALAVSKTAGFRNILFLDDDIRIPNSRHIRVAAGLLDAHYAVGLRPGGYPDNSVVCHANRQAGGDQDMFVGAGALMVDAAHVESFFPDVYNEDWLFLLDANQIRPVAITGSAVQQPYDPFASPTRARAEEFGDVLAEGLFARLDESLTVRGADERYWRAFIRSRRAFIDTVLRNIDSHEDLAECRRRRMIASLRAARDQLERRVKPTLCVAFMEAWQEDLQTWREFCERMPRHTSIEAGFAYFDLHDRAESVPADPAPASLTRC